MSVATTTNQRDPGIEQRAVLEVEGPTKQILPGQCLPVAKGSEQSLHPYTVRLFNVLCIDDKLVLNAKTVAEPDEDLRHKAFEDLPGPSSLQAFRGPGHRFFTPGLHHEGSPYLSSHSSRDIQPLKAGDAQALLAGRVADPKWSIPLWAVEDAKGEPCFDPESGLEVRLKTVDIPMFLQDGDTLGYRSDRDLTCAWAGRSRTALQSYKDRRLFLYRPGLICRHRLTHDEFHESGEDYTYGTFSQNLTDIQTWLLGLEKPRIRRPGRTAHSCSYEKLNLR